ncbi:MAG: NIL domain-containing protein [Acidimicrobiales bacterium]
MSTRVRLIYPDDLVKMPVIARLAKDYDVFANIRRASVEEGTGWIVCELEGQQEDIRRSLNWLREIGVQAEMLSDVVES